MRSLIGLLIIFSFSCVSTDPIDRPPNVIIIFTDDQGYNDVGVFGGKGFQTPHLDQMAKEGVILTDFHAAQPVCSASRAALLTGCYPNRIGIHNAFMPDAKIGLNQNETTIAEMLKGNGYSTAIFGKWHLGDHPDFQPRKHGFDEYFGIHYSNDMWPNHPWQGSIFDFDPLRLYENETVLDTLEDQSQLTTQITKRAVDFINRQKDNPFFLYVPHPQPHVPLFVSEKFAGKSEIGLYGDVMMELDWSVGEILKAVNENGLDENTLVIFTSDNGPWLSYGDHAGSAAPFREGKGTSWEGGHREPFIARYPGKIPAGTKVSSTMMNIDLLPTIAHLTNSKLPNAVIDGKNAADLLTGESTENSQEVYFHYYHVNHLQAARYGDWKMYFPHKYRSLGGRMGGTDGLPVEYDYPELLEIELYNLANDPSETKNVTYQNEEVVLKISSLADSIRIELGDELRGIKGSNNREPGKISR